MTRKKQEYTFLTIRQMVEKYTFFTYASLRKLIYTNEAFEKMCVRRLGRRVLIVEEKFLEFIEKSKKN